MLKFLWPMLFFLGCTTPVEPEPEPEPEPEIEMCYLSFVDSLGNVTRVDTLPWWECWKND